MHDILEVAKWLRDNGATGVLALACVVEGVVIYNLWKKRNEDSAAHAKRVDELQEARFDAVEAYTTKAEALHDKVYKTEEDLGKAIDIVEARHVRDTRRSRP